jgi:hypothetical protein
MNVLSIDLASSSYSKFGIAFLETKDRKPAFLSPKDLNLTGKPDPEKCAKALAAFCNATQTTVLMLDGSQAWRLPGSSIEHMRLAERVLNTPGKTGNPGQVKPKTYLKYTSFSIDLYHYLQSEYGWELLTAVWYRRRKAKYVVEVFPSSAWELLGLPRLPGKSKTKRADLDKWTGLLAGVTGYELPKGLKHDQLQAAVVLPAGEAIVQRNKEGVILSGMDPIITRDGTTHEGWIVNPRLA